jgi:PAS domain-containing protein
VENSREGILIFDKDKVSFANKTILNALNATSENIVGKTFKELVCKEHQDMAAEFFEKTINGTASNSFEVIKLRDFRGDSVVEFEVSAANSKYLGKKILIMFLRNITEERNIKHTSSFTTDRLHQVFENSSVPQVVLQYNGYIYDMNRAARERFGFTLQEKPLYTSIYIKPSLPLKARRAMQNLQEDNFDATIDFSKIKDIKGLDKKGKFDFSVHMLPINCKELTSGKKVADFLLELTFKGAMELLNVNEGNIIEDSPLFFQDAILQANRQGIILKANNQALQLLNLPFKDIEGKNLSDFVIPGEKLLIQSDIKEIYSQNSIKNRNYNLNLNKSVLPVEASAVLTKDNNFLFSLRNDTPRKQLMTNLAQRSSYIEALHNVIGSALLECEVKDGKFLKFNTANEQAVKITGYTLQELMDKTIADLLFCEGKTETQIQEYLDKVYKAIASGSPAKFTAKIKTKKDSLSVEMRVSYFESKTTKKALFLMRDNTTEKKLKNQLTDKEEELKGIRNILPGLYLKLDKDGIIKEYKADLSWTIAVFPTDFVGRDPKEYLGDNNAKNLHQLLQKAKQNNIPIQTNFSLEHTNGRRFYEAVISPISGEDSFQVLVNRVDNKKGLENRVRDLYAFSAGGETGFVENMEDILNFGKEIFKAQIGFICHFSGRAQEKIVINYTTPNSVIKKNIQVPVDECLGPIREGFISSYEKLSEVKCEKDCFHNKFDISSLIAAPLFINGKVEGAICFVSRNGALMNIGQEERNLISFLGGLMGVALELRKANKAMDNTFAALRKLIASLDVPAFITDEYLAVKNLNEIMSNICGLYQFENIQDENIFSKISLDMAKVQNNFESALKSSKGGSFDFIFDTKLADDSTENMLWHIIELRDGSSEIKGFLFVGESIKDLPRFRNLLYGPQKHN